MTPDALIAVAGPLAAAAILAVFLIPAIAISVWTLRSRRNPRTNAQCAVSVVYGLAVFLILLLTGLARAVFGAPPIVTSIGGFAAFFTLLVAVIMAINGLREMNHRFGRLHFDRGKKRAITVLTLPVVFAGIIVTSVIVHSSGTPLFSGEISGTAGETVVSKQWNFQLIAPPPWVRTEAARVHPAACAALARRGPTMSTAIVVEDLSKSGSPDLAGATAAVATKLRDSGHEVLAQEQQDEGGLPGLRLETASDSGKARTFQVLWMAVFGDNLYQVITSGPDAARDTVRNEARKLSAGFRIVDPTLSPLPAAERAPATFTSERFGYTTDHANTVWTRRWPTLEKEMPLAEFGLLNARGTAAFCIIPVWLGGYDDPGFEAIATALAARVGVPFNDKAIFGMRNVRQGAVRGRAFAYEKVEGDTKLLYRVRVLRGRGYAYLLAAWMNKKAEANSEFLDLAMDCVAFPEAADPKPLITGDRVRQRHSLVWNDIGLSLVRANTPLLAAPWFAGAYAVDRDNIAPLANQADVLVKGGHSTDALTLVEREAKSDPRPAVQRVYAQVLHAVGRVDEAVKVLQETRRAAPNDGDTTVLLTDIFIATKRSAEALTECDGLITALGDLPALLQRRAVALAQLGRFKDAQETLSRALVKEPNNRDILSLQQQVETLQRSAKK